MTGSVPWSINAVDPEAWADARDAARRSGQSVGEWLEAAIRDAANDRNPVRAPARAAPDAIEQRLDDIADRLESFSRKAREPGPTRNGRNDTALLASIEALNERIDALSRDVRTEDRKGPAEIRAAIQRLDERIEHVVSRGRLAEAGASPELERKLENISRTIEAMSQRLEQESRHFSAAPVPSTIDELDEAVAEIMMRQSVLDGVPPPREIPRRAPVQAPPLAPDLSGLERQLKLMADEMQAMRQSGMKPDSLDAIRGEIGDLAGKLGELAPRRSLESIERAVESIAARLDRLGGRSGSQDETLTEVVDALQDIRSALAEVRPAESFASVESDLRGISNKLDGLGGRGVDGNAIARLQEQTAEIRDLLSDALSRDVLKALVEQIELLVAKFERRPSESNEAILDIMTALDRRVEALAERLEATGREVPAASALEDIRQRLDDLQGAISRSGDGPGAGVEEAVRALSQKIDATDARLGNLGSIERGLADLFAQIEEARASARDSDLRATKPAARESDTPQPLPAVFEVSRRAQGELQTRYSSGNDFQREPAAAEPAITPRPVSPLQPMPAAEPANEIEDDFPLEPGSGAPRMRLQSAALRVAQSEAALGGIHAPPADAPARTSDFIAAARRAAQAANAEPMAEPAKAGEPSSGSGIVSMIGRNRRALLIALTAFLLIFAALRYFDGQLLKPFRAGTPAPAPVTMTPEPNTSDVSAPEDAPKPTTQSNAMNSGDAFVSAPPAGVLGENRDLHFTADAGTPEITGSTPSPQPAPSIQSAPIQTASAPASEEVVANEGDTLPAALGPQALRAAAIAGDPVAAYEIGVRYLEGRGVSADATEAAAWLERAWSKGSAPAAYRLGSIHEKGMKGGKNSAEALRYYTAAAEAGNIKAMHNLAVIFAEGADGKPDLKSAARWFRMAADRGVADSQYNLGVLYARGLGVTANLAESYRWFALAADQGDVDAGKKRDDVAKRLDAQTLVATKLAVQTWTAAPIETAANEVQLKPEWKTAEPAARKRSVKK
jgi:localization factor PodJL